MKSALKSMFQNQDVKWQQELVMKVCDIIKGRLTIGAQGLRINDIDMPCIKYIITQCINPARIT